MTTDLQGLYDNYVDYVRRLQDDFDRHVGPNVSPVYRPHLLGFDDFRRVWEGWGSFDGVQERWQRRFESGYEVVAEALTERLRAALCRRDRRAGDTSLGRAA